VEILVENKSHDIKPGMFVTVDIQFASAAGVLAVPNDAVLTRNGQDAVYVQTGDSSVERRVVETGLDSGSYIEIRSGLEEGDVVIVKGVGLISEESTLNIVRGDE
jgi:multidrug efflux pump subunit AcrA (membrane-fusion protein)